MAKAASKAAWQTTLAIRNVEVGVALFTAHADPKKKLVEFDTAGPHGGVLKAREVARPVPVAEAAQTPGAPVEHAFDPLDPDVAPPADVTSASSAPAVVDGEYGRELVEDGTDEVVAPDQVRRGVRLEDGSFVDCTEQLAAIEEETKLEKMDVIGFVDSTSIPRARVAKAYWLGAQDEKAPRALRLLFEGLKVTRRVALVKLTKRSRQALGVVGVHGRALMLFELVWAEDFREPPARATVIQKQEISPAMMTSMVDLIGAMAVGPSAVEELRDDAIALREELHADALTGSVLPALVDADVLDEADDVLAQLEASLAVA